MVNLLTNGDFELGNNGFSSSYTYYTGSSIPANSYAVGTDPSAFHSLWPSMGDHTSGSGNMFMANSASSSNLVCWSETVEISPQSNANLSFYAFGLYNGDANNAELDVYINGEKKTGGPFVVTDGAWSQFLWTPWFTNGNTSATVEIVPVFGGDVGRDFAIDDIVMDGVFIGTDSFDANTTYVSYFKDITDISNPLVNNSSGMQYTGTFDGDWDFYSVDIDTFGYGLKKTKYNHSSIFCNDASRLFSIQRGFVKMILNFRHGIVDGVHENLANVTDHNEYILWGVNMGEMDVAQPGIYAALTSSGLVFSIVSSKQTTTLTHTGLNLEAGEDVELDFVWEVNGVKNDIGRMQLVEDGEIVLKSFEEFTYSTGESFEDLPFYCLNTPSGHSDLECTIKSLRTAAGVPPDFGDGLFSSSSEMFSSSSSSSSESDGGGPEIGLNRPVVVFSFIDECQSSGYEDPAVRTSDITLFDDYIDAFPPYSGSRFVCFCVQPKQPSVPSECYNVFPGPSVVVQDYMQRTTESEWSSMRTHVDQAISVMGLDSDSLFYVFFSIDNSGSMTDSDVRAAIDKVTDYIGFTYPSCVTDDTYGSGSERWILDMLEAYQSLGGD